MFAFLFRLLGRRLLIAAIPTILSLGGAAIGWLLKRRRPSTEGANSPGPDHGETTPRAGVHTLSLHLTAEGERADGALEALRNQLGPRAVGDPDESGFFEVEVEAETWDGAAAKLRDAVAAAGADEAVELGEPSGRVSG
jgi:hypothetical protein